jgi:type II secretory pathway component PulF
MEDLGINLLFWALAPLVILIVAYGGYFALSLPLRRQERGRMLLDLIEMGFRQGHTAERTILRAAASGDRALGARFHLLAAHIEAGATLEEALRKVPRLVPPAVAALLNTGTQTGDVRSLLPACRERLEDGVASVSSAQHYLIFLVLSVGPAWIFLFWTFMVFVMPKFQMIFQDMGALPPGLMLMFAQNAPFILAFQATVVLICYVLAACYFGGPRLAGWVDRVWRGLPSRLAWLLPWRRQRLLRDFSALLARLLDAGVPEPRAVQLAASSSANDVVVERATRMQADLAGGRSLVEAIARLDDAGEFRWRLENAAQGTNKFLTALEGWHEALSARAFRIEQTSATLVTTGLVLLNGLFVGSLAVGVFAMFTNLINLGVLW